MSYMLAYGPCICCKRPFSYNPVTVPSTSAFTGEREPVCHGCMDQLNARRRMMGLAPFPIIEGAYDAEEVSC